MTVVLHFRARERGVVNGFLYVGRCVYVEIIKQSLGDLGIVYYVGDSYDNAIASR